MNIEFFEGYVYGLLTVILSLLLIGSNSEFSHIWEIGYVIGLAVVVKLSIFYIIFRLKK